ncbi:Leucine-responsive regulatory protein [Serratia marcescens]|nr:Leucine-responsive regulatory protein [Serratia marcescens]
MADNKKRPGKDLDRIDRNILNELQKDGRISNVELSKRVGLSPTPCLERVRRLERQGFIHGYTALLNPHYLDASLLVFVEITLNRGAPDVFEQFNSAVQKLEEIQECHLVSGDVRLPVENPRTGHVGLPQIAGRNLAAFAGG